MSNTIGEKFRLIRNTTGLSQPKFAELVGISVSSYKKYEGGHSEVGSQPLLTIANHPEFKKYALWLITGDTKPEAGQYSPSDKIELANTITTEQFEEKFVETVSQSLLMFCHLDWFKPNVEKQVDFDDCGKLILKDVKPLLAARYADEENTSKTA
ncbi:MULTISPECIES: DNA-binding transcriptional regulator [unclassified Pseudoalteromonas]|uniref:helix-turn-helix domain-containing protein n=1 Tax=unclassified Pseudoalteromonas TaxID=194690 RepID=UPI00191755B4|nr:helix-turn-helix transcriptional regulator [Pseudoalteromonas sp. GCY]QQQ65667.1 helix-turn-helix transcriptional regulator [Pseudoalteromonas sp. GCY]